MSASLLLAKLSVLGILAGYVPLFLGVPRYRRAFAAVLVGSFAVLLACSAIALQDTADLGRLTSHPLPLAGAVVGLIVLLAAASWAAYRWPVWATPAMLAVMPIRVPVGAGGSTASLLVPLYVAIVAILIAEVVVRDRLHPPAGRSRDPLRISLAALIVLCGISVFWVGLGYGPKYLGADWREEAFLHSATDLFAFYLPFGLVLLVVWRYVRDAAALRRLLLTVIVSGAVFAVIGAIQYPSGWIVFNRARLLGDVESGDPLRVNSLFYDPNMFSRMLLIVVILCVALMVVMPAWRRRLIGIAFLAAAVNVLTLSRSGWIALIVGLVVFCFAWLGRRRGLLVAGVAGLVLIVTVGGLIALRGGDVFSARMFRTTWNFDHFVGGRFYLGKGALLMVYNQPLRGMGLGGFQLAYPTNKYRNHHAYKNLTASHTTPFTVLAELGIPGFLLYVAVLWSAFAAAFRRRKDALLTAAPARAGPGGGGTAANPGDAGAAANPGDAGVTTQPAVSAGAAEEDARTLYLVRAGLGAVVAALVVHSLLYNAFFEDPYVWAVFGMISAAAWRLGSWRPGGTVR